MNLEHHSPGKSRDDESAPHGWHIRRATEHDYSRVAELLVAAGLPDEGLGEQFAGGYVVAESGGHIIAAAGVETYGRYGLLRSVAVEQDRQGGGVGEALICDRLEWSREQNFIAVFLITFVGAYFERLGFRRVDRLSVPSEIRSSDEFASICPESATVMALPLVAGAERTYEEVRASYAAIARSVAKGTSGEPGGSRVCCGDELNRAAPSLSSGIYRGGELDSVPPAAASASLGCGNPTALAVLKEGDTVLDLGSGGGIDVILSARRVGPTGRVYGLDMTDEMLELARKNQKSAGIGNAEFLKGHIEAIPLPDASVDVVISNCVINLSPDKSRVLREAARVLKPGGRFAVSDIVATRPVPESLKKNVALWSGCVSGALEQIEYKRLLHEANFRDVEVVPTFAISQTALCGCGLDDEVAEAAVSDALEGMFMSAFVRATKC